MSTFLTLFVLQNMKGVGPRTIFRIGEEKISSVETPQQVHELLDEIASSNSRIQTIPVEKIMSLMDDGKRIAEEHEKPSIVLTAATRKTSGKYLPLP